MTAQTPGQTGTCPGESRPHSGRRAVFLLHGPPQAAELAAETAISCIRSTSAGWLQPHYRKKAELAPSAKRCPPSEGQGQRAAWPVLVRKTGRSLPPRAPRRGHTAEWPEQRWARWQRLLGAQQSAPDLGVGTEMRHIKGESSIVLSLGCT